MIKAIIFDWFGVCTEEFSKRLVRGLSKEIKSKNAILKSYGKYELDFTLSKISSGNVLKNMFRDLKVNKSINDYLYIFNKTSKIRSEIFQLAKKLRTKYKTAILSDNFDEMTRTIRRNINLKNYFDIVLFSNEIGLVKRKDRIYRVIIKKLNCKPNECIFIDDKKENIRRAGKLGMNGVLFRNVRQVKKYWLNLALNQNVYKGHS
ncbi:HAD-IA family hydrolase [Candidatus Woesearchaeota archaeon]|nr:HAD-IA family hydrolase [Candidatus Woesearchaeota archaeon]